MNKVVYNGDVEILQHLLSIVAPPLGVNIWAIRSSDNKTMLDVAEEIGEIFPPMLQFVRERTNPLPPVPTPQPLPTAPPAPPITQPQVQMAQVCKL